MKNGTDRGGQVKVLLTCLFAAIIACQLPITPAYAAEQADNANALMKGPSAFRDPTYLQYIAKVEIDPATIRGKPGFFRVGKTKDGVWWFLRPDGKPFVHKGVCVAAGWPRNQFGKTLDAKYGRDCKRYTEDSARILDEAGFNAFGNWSFIFNSYEGWKDGGWPFVEHVSARSAARELLIEGVLDVFDPKWQAAYDAACKERCTPLKNNKNVLGWFTENEPGWAQALPDHVWGKTETNRKFLLQVFLAAPETRPGSKMAWDFVLKRHGNSVETVAKDWGATFKTADELRKQSEAGLKLNSEGYGKDQEDFSLLYAQTHFRVTGEAIRRYAPNHLNLGVRHAGKAEYHGKIIWKAYTTNYVDVLSHNCYNPGQFYERIDQYHRMLPDYPILIGEITWGQGHIKKDSPPETVRAAQENVGALFEKAFTHPALIGYTWFKWYSGNDPDLPSGCGVVTDNMEVNRFHHGVFQVLHPRLEGVRAGVIPRRLSQKEREAAAPKPDAAKEKPQPGASDAKQ